MSEGIAILDIQPGSGYRRRNQRPLNLICSTPRTPLGKTTNAENYPFSFTRRGLEISATQQRVPNTNAALISGAIWPYVSSGTFKASHAGAAYVTLEPVARRRHV
jgi:hypothetical protein